jgi:hypothetical protein
VSAWQALTVHYNFGGNWTALYYTGAKFKGVPPGLKPENIYLFPNFGYDAQVYHYIAHDPLFRRNYGEHMDEPQYRGRRILVPGLAFLLAFGRDGWIDRAYIVVIWFFAGLGAYWLARFAQLRGYPVWFGLGFVFVPAVLISIDRLTVDIALAACCLGFVLYAAENATYKLYAVLLAASLSRETGLLLTAAYCIYLAVERDWKRILISSTSALPVAGWYLFLRLHTPPIHATLLSAALFSGIASVLLHPFAYPFGGPVQVIATALDLLALAGILACLVWVGWRAFHRAWTPVIVAAYLFTLLAITTRQATRGQKSTPSDEH